MSSRRPGDAGTSDGQFSDYNEVLKSPLRERANDQREQLTAVFESQSPRLNERI